MHVCRVRQKVVANAPVGEHNALGLSGRAGGVDHISKLVAAHFDFGVLSFGADQKLGNVDRLAARIIRKLVRGGDNICRAAVLYDRPYPVGRILRVAGDERRACLVHTEKAAKEAAFSGQEQRNAVARLYSPVNKIVRNNIRALVELAVGHGLVLCDQRGFVGVFSRALLKQLVQKSDRDLGFSLG